MSSECASASSRHTDSARGRIGESNVLHTGHHACLRVEIDPTLDGATVPEGQARTRHARALRCPARG